MVNLSKFLLQFLGQNGTWSDAHSNSHDQGSVVSLAWGSDNSIHLVVASVDIYQITMGLTEWLYSLHSQLSTSNLFPALSSPPINSSTPWRAAAQRCLHERAIFKVSTFEYFMKERMLFGNCWIYSNCYYKWWCKLCIEISMHSILERLFSYVQKLDNLAARSKNPIVQSTEEEANIDNAGFKIQKHINRRVNLLMQYFNGSICWSDLYEKHLLYPPRIHYTRMEMQKEEAKGWYAKWRKRQKRFVPWKRKSHGIRNKYDSMKRPIHRTLEKLPNVQINGVEC